MNKAYYWYRPLKDFGSFYPGKILNLIDYPNIYAKYFPELSLRKLCTRYFPNGLNPHGIFQLTPLKKENKDSEEPVVELIFELVRQLQFPDAPSRLTSLYASSTLQQAKLWKLLWEKNFPGQDRQIPKQLWEIEFETSAKLYDAKLLEVSQNNEFSYLRYLDNAYRYWDGEQSATPLYELLIPFPVTLVQQIII